MGWNPFKPQPVSTPDPALEDVARRRSRAADEATYARYAAEREARIWELRKTCSRGPDNTAHDNCYGH